MKCLILCGGLGTRLGAYAGQVPKVLAPIGGRPMLEHLVAGAWEAGVAEVWLLTGHLSSMIEDLVDARSDWAGRVRVIQETEPLGTAGSVRALAHELSDDFLLLYGDVMMSFDLRAMVEFHQQRNALATLAIHPNDHPFDSDLLEMDATERIVAFHPKPRPAGRAYRNLVNAGAYMLSPKVLQWEGSGRKADFGRDVFPSLVDTGRLYGYLTAEYLKDMGTPDRYDRVQRDWASGRVRYLHRRQARPAVVLEADWLCHLLAEPVGEESTKVTEALARLNRAGWVTVVYASTFAAETLPPEWAAKLDAWLGAAHIWVDAIFDEASLAGIGGWEAVWKRFHPDRPHSFWIGLARAAGQHVKNVGFTLLPVKGEAEEGGVWSPAAALNHALMQTVTPVAAG